MRQTRESYLRKERDCYLPFTAASMRDHKVSKAINFITLASGLNFREYSRRYAQGYKICKTIKHLIP